jgi:hypothetical protein
MFQCHAQIANAFLISPSLLVSFAKPARGFLLRFVSALGEICFHQLGFVSTNLRQKPSRVI